MHQHAQAEAAHDSQQRPRRRIVHAAAIVRTDRHQAPCRLPPIKAQYVVAWLKGDYSQTIIARDARDYAWIMARTPTIPATDYDAVVARIVDMGYMAKNIRKVPQRWPDGAGERREGSE